MLTIKLKIKSKTGDYSDYIREFNNLVRFAYNRFHDQPDLKVSDVEILVKSTMKNLDLLDASLIKQGVLKAQDIFRKNKDSKVIFGGRFRLKSYVKKLISREEYLENKLIPLRVVGSIMDNGNRKFKLDLANKKVIFKPCRANHITLELEKTSKGNIKLLNRLQELVDERKACFTVELNKDFVFIIFDEAICKVEEYSFVRDRIGSIDMNPNYVAFTVQENGKILCKKLYSLKGLNDLDSKKNYKTKENKVEHRVSLNNKRQFEIVEIAKDLMKYCEHFKVESFAIEDLNIKSKNHKKGKSYNKLCNNVWNRNLLFNNLRKRCGIVGIKFEAVFAGYSSIKGQLENESEIDSIGASIEIGKRVNKDLRNFGDTEVEIGKLSNRWKEEIVSNCKQFCTWKDVSKYLKEVLSSYRNFFSPDKFSGVSYSLNSDKSFVKLYDFI